MQKPQGKERHHRMASDKDIFNRVYRSVPVPPSLPLETSQREYREAVTREVMGYVHKGYSVERSFQTVTGEKMPKSRRGRHRKESPRPALRWMVAGVTLVASLAGGTVIASHIVPSSPSANSSLLASDDELAGNAKEQNERNLLIVGMDTRPEKDNGSGSSDDVPGSRTDAIAVVRINPDSVDHKVSVVSIPRDTGVYSDSCGDPSGYVEGYGTYEKINGLYENYGMDCLSEVAGGITGVDIDGSIAVNFASFVSLIDSIGGVDITTSIPVVDDTLGTIVPSAGTHHLNGEQALDYARARKVEGTEKSDFGRVKRQQKVGKAILKSLNDSSYVKKASAATSMLTDVIPEAELDGISPADMLSLLNFARTLSGDDISTKTLPIVGEDGFGNLIYNEEESRSVFDEPTSYPTGSVVGERDEK